MSKTDNLIRNNIASELIQYVRKADRVFHERINFYSVIDHIGALIMHF